MTHVTTAPRARDVRDTVLPVRNSLVFILAPLITLILLYLQMTEYNEQYHQYTKTHIISTLPTLKS